MNLPLINSHNGWSKLEEVWLGDVYPDNFFDHLPTQISDSFAKINEITREDLQVIVKKLQSLDVNVVRPQYNSIDNQLDRTEQLIKPDITPRDHGFVYGNDFYISYGWDRRDAWRHALDQYEADSNSNIKEYKCKWKYKQNNNKIENELKQELGINNIPPELIDAIEQLSGANTVRYGIDLLFDYNWIDSLTQDSETTNSIIKPLLEKLFPNSRIHLVSNGGHVDGCFSIAKPGHLLTSTYFEDYNYYFPQWQCININEPEFSNQSTKSPFFQKNSRFWMEEMTFPKSFNDHVLQYAQDWIGEPCETIFEVNSLVVDEKNILVLGENESVFRALENIGFNVHSVPFRARTFWDGGLHCLTLDIRRQSQFKKYVY